MTKAQKKKRKADNRAAKRDNRKCSGPKACHGMRSAVAKTWDASKGSARAVKVLAPSQIPAERLDAMARKIAEATGWSFEWVRARRPDVILRLAQKHL